MTTVIITRHGHVEGIDPPRFRGRAELELSPLGRQQIKALADRLAEDFRIDQIYSSPLRRCIATAEAIAAAVHAPVEGVGELLDLDYGEWQGQTHAKMGELHPEMLARWYATPHLVRFPRGESLQHLAVRAADLLRSIRERYPEGTVVLVGHDSIDRVLMLQLLDMPLASYWRLEHQPCSVSVVELGATRTMHRSRQQADWQLSFYYGHFPWLGSPTAAMDATFERIAGKAAALVGTKS